ncbi:flagellin [Candidatus Njordibacter sp. Uisw_056]|uniref:flagellin N-terminal helical domain-containing protein n=1 Tax=Candidatus Njordibacter sp. Uisw_056 TaxID=3230973 RepID=UPI003D5A83FA
MGMVIGTNVASLQAQRHLESSRGDMETAMERLASGQRINSAADDAAGMAIANKIEVKVMSLNQGIRNANDGMSMVQVAEGGMEEIGNILGRMKELAVQASNGTYESGSLTTMNNEYTALRTEITRIAQTTEFNGVSVLNSTDTPKIQVGDKLTDTIDLSFQKMRAEDIGGTGATVIANFGKSVTAGAAAAPAADPATLATQQSHVYSTATISTGNSIQITVAGDTYAQAFETSDANTMTKLVEQINAGGDADASVTSNALTINSKDTGLGADVASGPLTTFLTEDENTRLHLSKIETSGDARLALDKIDTALKQVDNYRATLGSVSKTLDHTVSNLMNRVESQSAALSRIKDADYAVESANLAKAQVLQQAGTAMLAQANASGEGVLQLLK